MVDKIDESSAVLLKIGELIGLASTSKETLDRVIKTQIKVVELQGEHSTRLAILEAHREKDRTMSKRAATVAGASMAAVITGLIHAIMRIFS